MIWFAVGSLKNSSLEIVSWAGKSLITWRLSEQPPTSQTAALTHAKKKKKRPFIKSILLESAWTTNEHPRRTWCLPFDPY